MTSTRLITPGDILRSKSRRIYNFTNVLISGRAMKSPIKRTGKLPCSFSNKSSSNKDSVNKKRMKLLEKTSRDCKNLKPELKSEKSSSSACASE